jgi:hypothetical protein
MAYGIQEPIDLARIIVAMSYGGLTRVADSLVKMNAPDSGMDRDVKTVVGMAETLFDWAESVVEEAYSEARAAKDKAA